MMVSRFGGDGTRDVLAILVVGAYVVGVFLVFLMERIDARSFIELLTPLAFAAAGYYFGTEQMRRLLRSGKLELPNP